MITNTQTIREKNISFRHTHTHTHTHIYILPNVSDDEDKRNEKPIDQDVFFYLKGNLNPCKNIFKRIFE